MKTIILFLSLFTLVCCNTPTDVRSTQGVIKVVMAIGKTTYIKVDFDNDKTQNTDDIWFVASDTCKVGQIVNLR